MDFDVIVATLYIVDMLELQPDNAVFGLDVYMAGVRFGSLKRQVLKSFVGRSQEYMVGIGGEQKVQCIQPETVEGFAFVR